MRYYQSLLSTHLVGIEEPSYIHPSAKIGKDVYIAAFTYVGENAVVGDNVKLYPHTFLGNGVTIGNDTTQYVLLFHNPAPSQSQGNMNF